jgi:hypothetical protein
MINCLDVMISLPPEPAHFIFEVKLFIIIAESLYAGENVSF